VGTVVDCCSTMGFVTFIQCELVVTRQAFLLGCIRGGVPKSEVKSSWYNTHCFCYVYPIEKGCSCYIPRNFNMTGSLFVYGGETYTEKAPSFGPFPTEVNLKYTHTVFCVQFRLLHCKSHSPFFSELLSKTKPSCLCAYCII
jgi:hypothetical protein